MKTQDLIGDALDWAVAKAEGFPERVWTEVPMPEDYTCCCGLSVHPTKRNWSALHILECPHSYAYSTDWAHGGPIIQREGIELLCNVSEAEAALTKKHEIPWTPDWFACSKRRKHLHFHGPTPLIAAMRCYVAQILGSEVEIPSKLV